MPQIDFTTRIVDAIELRRFIASLLTAAGVEDGDARLTAETLVMSNLRGIDSHGVARVLHYLERIAAGSCDPRASMTFEQLSTCCGRVDARHGLGQVAMWKATNEAIGLARDAGAGWVALCNSTHCGALAYYGLEIARQGMIGLVFTHSDAMVLPYGGRKPFCGTNPICITIEGTDGKALCLDMATSVTPWNTIVNAAIEGVALPVGWAVDTDGNDTTDAKQVGAVYPVGAYKGSGLGLMIDVLCSMLGGGPYGPDISVMYGDPSQKRLLGGLVGAIDIERFAPVEQVRCRIAELMTRWNGWPAQSGREVLYPGQPEERTYAQRVRDGVPLGVELLGRFAQLAAHYKVTPLHGTLS